MKMEYDELYPEYFPLVASLLILVSAPTKLLLQRVNSSIPHTFVLIILACILGSIMSFIPHMAQFKRLFEYGSPGMLQFYHVFYIFSNMYTIDFYVFKKFIGEVIVLTITNLFVKITVLALTNISIIHQDWPMHISLIYTAAFVPNEPSIVINMFNDISKNKLISTVLESEAVLTLIPSFTIVDIIYGYNDGIITHWYQFVLSPARIVCGGAFIGVIFGKLIMYAMSFQYKEPFIPAGICFGLILTTHVVAHHTFNVSGTLAVTVISIIIGTQKHNISSVVDSSLTIFFGFVHYIANISIVMIFSAYVIMSLTPDDHPISIYYALLVYITTCITRFSVYLIVGWFLSRFFHYIGVKQLIILAWSGIGGSLNMIMAVKLLTQINTHKEMYCLLVETVCFCLFSLFITCTSMKIALRILNIVDISTAYKSNLKNCLKFITERRMNIINMLKVNRYLSNANWIVVRNETNLKQSFKKRITENPDDDDDDDVIRTTTAAKCPQCSKDIPFLLSESELNSMMREARVKVIKAKQVSIIKQYENGVVTKHVYLALKDIFENVLENTSKDELYYLKKYFYHRKKNQQKKWKETIAESHKYYLCRRICFYIMMHKVYDYMKLIVALVQLAICNYYLKTQTVHLIPYCIMIVCFIADCVIKVLGLSITELGLKQYLLDKMNTIELVMLILQMGMVIESYFIKEVKRYLSGVVLFLTLIRLVLIIFPLIGFVFSSQKATKAKICFGYELTTALINCYDELIDILPVIIEVKKIRDEFLLEITKLNNSLKKEVDIIQLSHPSITITVKTKQVIRSTLKSMENTVHELKSTGFVDDVECSYILNVLQVKQKALLKMKFIHPSSANAIFNEVPWMIGDDRVIEFLYKRVETVSLNAGEVICEEGNFSKGIYILVTGLLRLKYIPRENLLKLSEAGHLPIVDYLYTTQFNVSVEDSITSGNTIGELSLLTGRPYDCTIIAETPCRAYLLTSNIISEAMKISSNRINGLEARMWKFAVYQLGLAILMEAPVYRSLTQDQIKLKIHRSFVPDISFYKIFTITDGMEDIILVEGIVADYEDGRIFTAPLLIPKFVQKLLLPSSSFFSFEEIVETKLLVIPNVNISDFNLVVQEGENKELRVMASSKCLLHLVKDKHSKKKGIKMMSSFTSSIDDKSILFASATHSLTSHDRPTPPK